MTQYNLTQRQVSGEPEVCQFLKGQGEDADLSELLTKYYNSL
jgi:hypothetical protein